MKNKISIIILFITITTVTIELGMTIAYYMLSHMNIPDKTEYTLNVVE